MRPVSEAALTPTACSSMEAISQIGHPTQITKAMIACHIERPHHDGPELNLQGNHGRLVVQTGVHPRRPICAPGPGAVAQVHLLARQKSDLVRVLYRGGYGFPENASRADNPVARWPKPC